MMPHNVAAAFAFSSGPLDARIALVGEAHGEQEQLVGKPFVGASGQELTRLLSEASIERKDCFLTNVIAARPSATSNKFDFFCGSASEVGKTSASILPPVSLGRYLRPEYLGELERLSQELARVRPNVVVALGGKASWALLGNSAISKIRGTTSLSSLKGAEHLKVLPTFHPSYLFQVWKDRPIVLADLMKARRESAFPEFRRPERLVLVNPKLKEISFWVTQTLLQPPPLLSCDIETFQGQIESIAFARSRSDALVIPFILHDPIRSYWPSAFEERCAREFVGMLLASDIPKVGQNFLYDTQYLLAEGFTMRACAHDTMLLHHSKYPELQKGLGFLGSIYTNEPAWKLMRHRKKVEELKRDD